MVPSAVWLFVIACLWIASYSSSGSALDATIQSFVLSLADGDWVPIVLLPVAGCTLSITMRIGHQVDRWLFTALGAGWLVWFWLNIHFPLAPAGLTAALVALATAFTWTRSMNQWVGRVQMWEMDRAGLTPESNA